MFSLTGKPTKKQIENELQNFKNAKIDQVMIYARSGMETEYMSEDWLNLCDIVIDYAEKHKMGVWIYDDYNWPSGSCKHAVEKLSKNFCAKRFVFDNNELKICELIPKESGLVLEPFITDLLNPNAVDCFIELTHEVYYKRYKKHFGKVIKGFFTDEPSFIYTATQSNTFPYYDGVERDYFNACNRSLKDDMTAFFRGETLETFPSVFYEVLGKRFNDCFFKKLGNWCASHNVELTGHVMCDDNVCANIKSTGNWFDCLENFSTPGIDNILSNNGPFFEYAYACLEVLRRKGKKTAMDELFALGPDSMTFAKRNNIIWHNAAFGINRYFLALSHLDARGCFEKHDYFHHVGAANPNFEGFKLLVEEAKKAAKFAEKIVKPQVSIRFPFKNGLNALNNRKEKELDSNVLSLISLLDEMQIVWELILENEKSKTPITICPNETGFWVENVNSAFCENELKDYVSKNVKPSVFVADCNGNLAKNVFIREYTDGSVLVLDRNSNEKRNLVLKRAENNDLPFTLFTDGVCVFERNAKREKEEKFEIKSPQNLSVSFGNPNLLRPKFDGDGVFKFILNDDLEITVNLCAYKNPDASLLLDGETIEFKNPCTVLTHCFNPLFISSKEMKLKKGEHTLTKLSGNDFAYFPLAVLSGKFCKFENVLSKDFSSGNVDFFGNLTVSFDVEIDKNAKEIYILDENNCYTTLFINGEIHDEKILPPFNFSVPKKFHGKKIRVALCYHSSLAPVFGDASDLVELDWCKGIASTPETIDVKKIKILKK